MGLQVGRPPPGAEPSEQREQVFAWGHLARPTPGLTQNLTWHRHNCQHVQSGAKAIDGIRNMQGVGATPEGA